MKFKLDHVNITVKDLEQSIRWYQDILGMRVVEQGKTGLGKRWAIVERDDSMICMTEYPNYKSANLMDNTEFFQIYHFGFRTPDKKAWEDVVSEHNLKLYYGGVNEYPNSLSWYIKDPSGHTIEVSYSESKNLF